MQQRVICGKYTRLWALSHLLKPLENRLSYMTVMDVCKGTVSMLGVPIAFVLNKSFEKNIKFKLYKLGSIRDLCQDKQEKLMECSCDGAFEFDCCFEECKLNLQALQIIEYEKTTVQEPLRKEIVGGQVQLFKRYHKHDIF